MINLTTGPVGIIPAVTDALMRPPISHRSAKFAALHRSVTTTLCHKLQVKDTYILTGSGTLANEMMIAQIALSKGHGLILSNGEFGDRLIKQATRQQLDFEVLRADEDCILDIPTIAKALHAGHIKWLLFCHCESSTGIINPIEDIIALCKENNCEAYIDCMSTFGAMELKLADVAMATASSGKGIGAYAGLALVFANKPLRTCSTLPLYLDLLHTQQSGGVPFTLSSNLLEALDVAIQQNMTEQRWNDLSAFSALVYDKLTSLQLAPFAMPNSRIFTIIPQNGNATVLAGLLQEQGIQVSYQSDYLVKRNWLQLALLGAYTTEEIDHVMQVVSDVLILHTSAGSGCESSLEHGH